MPLVKARAAARFLVGGAVIGALLLCVGLFLTRVLHDGGVLRRDLQADRWLAAHRTSPLDQLSRGATWLAQTPTAMVVALLAFLFLGLVLHRWRESWFVVSALTGQLLVFLTCAALVDRPRPPVARLDVAPPTSSFPSGHTGAAVALYGSLAVVLVIHGGRRPWALLSAVILATLPLAVAVSRVYRGMHYPSDVIAGATNGGLWIVLAATTLFPRRTSTALTKISVSRPRMQTT
jgi:undecaprenyl-diphosphatase